MTRIPQRALALALSAALCGCSVALNGAQRSGHGGTAHATSAATQAHAHVGSAKVSASFGTAAPPGSPGGQVSLSRGAAGILVFGLVLADLFHYVSRSTTLWTGEPSADRATMDPGRSIAHTCSCYGYERPAELAATAATE